jgi:beta-galactosidase/beta-glucuronidase
LPQRATSGKLALVHDVISAGPAAATDLPRLQVRAKFFFEGENKFYLQGVTYGPFRPATEGGVNLPTPEKVAVDFKLMRELGVNVLRVYHTPPRWFLDLAQKFRLRVMVTIPWHKRVLFLDDGEAVDTIRQNVAKAALANAGHPAMLGFFIDNEIPPDLVRWYGARRMEEFLNSLVHVVKKNDRLREFSADRIPPAQRG